jgi:hypothetical protein
MKFSHPIPFFMTILLAVRAKIDIHVAQGKDPGGAYQDDGVSIFQNDPSHSDVTRARLCLWKSDVSGNKSA